jgi:hypothetical protein
MKFPTITKSKGGAECGELANKMDEERSPEIEEPASTGKN